jgi:sugar diacid utilization regulator
VARDEIQVAVDELAEQLQRSVVINDAGVHLRYASAHYGDEDPVRVRAVLQREADSKVIGHVLAQGVSTWTTAGVIPPNDALEMKTRVCVPIRWEGELLGLLIVLDADSSLTTTELIRINEVAADLAPAMAAREGSGDGESREHAVLDLVGREPLLRRRALAELAPTLDADRFLRVTAVELGTRDAAEGPVGPHARTALRDALRIRPPTGSPGQLHAVTAGTAVLLLGGPGALPDHVVRSYVERLVHRVRDLSAGRFDCVAGIGTQVAGLDQAFESAAQAGLARRAAATALRGAVAAWAELGAYSLLLRIPNDDLNEAALPAEVRQLQRVDRDGQLAHTLRVYLDHAGNGPSAADALHIHRTTLYYRLGRITRLTGLDLDDGRTRLALHLGLTLLDVVKH